MEQDRPHDFLLYIIQIALLTLLFKYLLRKRLHKLYFQDSLKCTKYFSVPKLHSNDLPKVAAIVTAKIYFVFNGVCIIYTWRHTCQCRCPWKQKASDSTELELEIIVIKLGSSARAVATLNH